MQVNGVIIGVDPHKLSATIEVLDRHERLLGSGRCSTDKAGYAALRRYVSQFPDRVWAIEGANGAGRPLAQRLVEDGEPVIDVPAKLAARVRLFDTAQPQDRRLRRALDRRGRGPNPRLRVVAPDGELEALRMLTERRDELAHQWVQTVNRLQWLLAELISGQRKRDSPPCRPRRCSPACDLVTSPGRPDAGSPSRSSRTWSPWTAS
jgi:transposase